MKNVSLQSWFWHITGIDMEQVCYFERVISAVEGFLGIGGILLVTTSVLSQASAT